MSKPRVGEVLLICGLIAVAAVYFVITMTTNDPIWIWPKFEGRPSSIVVHHAGAHAEIVPGDADYDAINDELNAALSKISTYHESLGVSDDTVAEYRQVYTALEVHYDEPIVIHTRFLFGRPKHLLIPLSGRHSEYNPVFGGTGDSYRPGALGLEDLEPLKRELAQRGYID